MKQTRKQAKAKPEQPLSLEDLDRIVGGTARGVPGVNVSQEDKNKQSLPFDPGLSQQVTPKSSSG